MTYDRMKFAPEHADGVVEAGKRIEELLQDGMIKTGRRDHEVSAAWMISRALLSLGKSFADADGQDTDLRLAAVHESLMMAAEYVRAARAERTGAKELARVQRKWHGVGKDDGHPYAVEVQARVLLPGGEEAGMTVTARPRRQHDVSSPDARLQAGPRTVLDVDAAMGLLGQAYMRAAGMWPWAFDDGEHDDRCRLLPEKPEP